MSLILTKFLGQIHIFFVKVGALIDSCFDVRSAV
jgi:hypothetical protein